MDCPSNHYTCLFVCFCSGLSIPGQFLGTSSSLAYQGTAFLHVRDRYCFFNIIKVRGRGEGGTGEGEENNKSCVGRLL